ncbi:hypothetical protein HNY73_002104 [Argiope bruennichi]|uniref:Uncharacterized protein n=1 Tax=Argiope bruennichi TaxID=94029 RepID=A0A8T0FSE0_ARGBR|nr:hypothetical protein HNY73_002104 [Argiope bruennichi]
MDGFFLLEDREHDGPRSFLEHFDGFLVGEALQTLAVDAENLVSELQLAVPGRRAVLEQLADVDGKIAVPGAIAPYDAEAQAGRSPLQSDCFNLLRAAKDTCKQTTISTLVRTIEKNKLCD